MKKATQGFITNMVIVIGTLYLANKDIITTDTQVIAVILGLIIQAIYDKEG